MHKNRRLKRKLVRMEYEQVVRELIRRPEVRAMQAIPAHGGVNCLNHSIFVSYLSYRWVRRFGGDAQAAARGALLHDLFLYNWRDGNHEGHHGFTHPKTALRNAERIARLNSTERDIILKHMWPLTPRKPAYHEAWVVSWMDKVCATCEALHLYHGLRMERKLSWQLLYPWQLA